MRSVWISAILLLRPQTEADYRRNRRVADIFLFSGLAITAAAFALILLRYPPLLAAAGAGLVVGLLFLAVNYSLELLIARARGIRRQASRALIGGSLAAALAIVQAIDLILLSSPKAGKLGGVVLWIRGILGLTMIIFFVLQGRREEI